MKSLRALVFVSAVLLSLPLFGQQQNVSWSISSEDLGNNVHKIIVKGDIKSGWHIYDSGQYDNGGPNPTVITFQESDDYELIDSLSTESSVNRYFDATFGMEIGTIDSPAVFSQKIRLLSEPAEISCNVEWMACNEDSCSPLDDRDLSVTIGETSSGADTAGDSSSKGLWGLILEALLWGLAALLTPCVFPMIPMTVSFFIKGDGNGKARAAIYGLFIVLLFTLPITVIILLTRFIGGAAVTADIFNWISTHWLPNILFFLIFMAFAASFFGAFEIVLPSRLVNGSDSRVDRKKGLGGVFFLALTLVLVSFSCTGPIVGTVLIKSTAGEFWAPVLTMLVFSTAFALPFVLFALFPGMLKRIPKSGGWLNSVKVVLGFIEIALGFKFLSTADQVYHWGILDREVYLAIWIVCFTLLGFYLLGKLRFKYDSPLEYISATRLTLAIAVFSFVVYMIPGMWGAPLKALSGYLPPMQTQDFVLEKYTATPAVQSGLSSETRKYSDLFEMPLGLSGYFDLEEAEAAAEKIGKPLLIDFSGHGCVNCREMESRVWSDPQVLELLRNEFIICTLYTDDKTRLPEEEWITTPNGRVLKTIGKINANIALNSYGVNAQPNYVIQNPQGEIVKNPRGYNLDVDSYIEWLKSAL